MRRIVLTDPPTYTHACKRATCEPSWSCLLCLTSGKPQATCLNRARELQTRRPPERQNAGGIRCGGRDEQQRSSKRQRLAGACPGRSIRGLYWPKVGREGGWLRLGWGCFSVFLKWSDVRVWRAAGNHRNSAEETKGFHHTPRRRVEIHTIKTVTVSTKDPVPQSGTELEKFQFPVFSNGVYERRNCTVAAVIVGGLHYRGQCIKNICVCFFLWKPLMSRGKESTRWPSETCWAEHDTWPRRLWPHGPQKQCEVHDRGSHTQTSERMLGAGPRLVHQTLFDPVLRFYCYVIFNIFCQRCCSSIRKVNEIS